MFLLYEDKHALYKFMSTYIILCHNFLYETIFVCTNIFYILKYTLSYKWQQMENKFIQISLIAVKGEIMQEHLYKNLQCIRRSPNVSPSLRF